MKNPTVQMFAILPMEEWQAMKDKIDNLETRLLPQTEEKMYFTYRDLEHRWGCRKSAIVQKIEAPGYLAPLTCGTNGKVKRFKKDDVIRVESMINSGQLIL